MTLNEWVKRETDGVRLIADCLNVSDGYVYMLLSGKYKINPERTAAIARLTGLTWQEVNPYLNDVLNNRICIEFKTLKKPRG